MFNPNSELYAESIDGFILKPRQCKFCKCLFTPDAHEQIECSNCNPLQYEKIVIMDPSFEIYKITNEILRLKSARSNAIKKGDFDLSQNIHKQMNSLKNQIILKRNNRGNNFSGCKINQTITNK